MGMAKMILVGGEKDGHGLNGELTISPKDRPDVFYAVPNLDEDKIKKTRGNQAKIALHDQLAVLAYEFDEEHSSGDRFLMKRNAKLDKSASVG
jgi:hypothetical protein